MWEWSLKWCAGVGGVKRTKKGGFLRMNLRFGHSRGGVDLKGAGGTFDSLRYRAKKAKEFFPCSKEFFSFLSPVQQIDHDIFTQLHTKYKCCTKLHFSDQSSFFRAFVSPKYTLKQRHVDSATPRYHR